MPAYPWLFRQDTAIGALKNKIDVLRTLGVPYPAWSATEINATATDQAKQIARDLRAQQRLVAPEREVVALIAYLQKLGMSEAVAPAGASGGQ
jgi:cytochrome c oxidase cbb3-type subunit I/II